MTTSSTSRSIYFQDNKRKVDIVVVVNKENSFENDGLLKMFLKSLKEEKLEYEEEVGLTFTKLKCIKIHCPTQTLDKYAELFGFYPSFSNPNYKFYWKERYYKLSTILSKKADASNPIFKRAKDILSGERPRDYINSERSHIVSLILKTICASGQPYDLAKLKKRKIIKSVYALHDGSADWTEDGPLNERQLLKRYWANPLRLCHEQPLSLIFKYFGSEVAYYFAWMEFYTKMLVPAAILGVLTFLVGLILYNVRISKNIESEICESKKTLCPFCDFKAKCVEEKLSNHCMMYKLHYIIDNEGNVLFLIAVAFWGGLCMARWKRFEAKLNMRWNVNAATIERLIRPQFLQSNPKMKRSSITGQDEFHIPSHTYVVKKLLVIFVFLIFIIFYIISLLGLILLRLEIVYQIKHYIIGNPQYIMIFDVYLWSMALIIFSNIIDLITPKICAFLCDFQNPETELQYDDLYIIKFVTFQVVSTFFPIFYSTFIKGHLSSYPGDDHHTMFKFLNEDVCSPAGCLIDTTLLVVNYMLLKNIRRFIVELFTPIFKVTGTKFRLDKYFFRKKYLTQWEEDFALQKAPRNFLFKDYWTIMKQYCFITFFVTAFPLAPLMALINNLIEIRGDAIKLTLYYKRTIPRKTNGIGSWNTIFTFLTILGSITHPLVIVLNSNLIPRIDYISDKGTLKGFINSTFSEFAYKDLPNAAILFNDPNIVKRTCYYRSQRYPPNHPQKYNLNKDYFQQLTIKFIVFIVLENICLIASLYLKYVIPKYPRKVRLKIQHEQIMLQKMHLERANRLSRTASRATVNLYDSDTAILALMV